MGRLETQWCRDAVSGPRRIDTMRRLHALRYLTVALLLLASAHNVARARDWPVARGSFVQDWLVAGWTDARWDAEFAAMKQVGMDTFVFQSVCDSKAGVTYYPTSIPGLRQASGHNDSLGKCLRAAERAGIQVFVGLNFHGDWWSKGASDPAWLNAQMELGNRIADEVYDRYRAEAPHALHGWYWVWEVNIAYFAAASLKQNLAAALDISVKHLHALAPGMPVMLSPFENEADASPDTYRTLWTWMFANCTLGAGDIFCPQDSVGAGMVSLANLPAMFAALKQAVDTKPGLRFWSDTETFHIDDWTARTLGELVAQLKAVQPYVERSIIFAWTHYLSPNNLDPAMQCTLMGYVSSGTLEKSPPTVPKSFKAVREANGAIRLTWQPSRDDMRVFGYEIRRGGTRITRQQSPRGNPVVTGVPTTFLDTQAPATGAVTYLIRAYDFAGNFSLPATATAH
jgi:hypothetical protein